MAVSELTREQQVQLDLITKILPDEVVNGMSRHELKIYRELLTARDQAEEGFLSQNRSLPPKSQALMLGEEEPIPDDLKLAPSAPPAPVSEPIRVESQVEPPTPAEPVTETDIPATGYDPVEVAAWEKKLSDLNDRYRNAQAALSPAQQVAATLRKKLTGAEKEIDQVRQEMADRFERLEKLLESKQVPAPREADPMDGLDELDPDLARRLRALEARVEAKAMQPFKKLQDDMARRDEEARESATKSFIASHDATVRTLVPDFDALVGDPTIKDWLVTQPPIMRAPLVNPYNHTPQDVAYAFSQFRASKRATPAAKKPSLGDLAANVRLSPPTPLHDQPSGQDLLTDEQMNSIELLLRKQMQEGKDPSALMDRYERTLLAKQKTTPNR